MIFTKSYTGVSSACFGAVPIRRGKRAAEGGGHAACRPQGISGQGTATLLARLLCACLVAAAIGCGSSDEGDEGDEGTPAETAAIAGAPGTEAAAAVGEDRSGEPRGAPVRIPSPEDLRRALKQVNPGFDGQVLVQPMGRGVGVAVNDPAVRDISPLAELPLVVVDLSETQVTDLSPLRGKPLEVVYLSHVPVEDISPLEGAPIRELNLLRTRVRDLTPLRDMRYLGMLWLNDTPVEDIRPLATVPLVSLTLAGTRVSDLTPLKGHPTLQRLHIARTPVSDLSVLRWLRLTRLIFTPGRIEKGIEYARAMHTLREIGTAFGEPEYGDDRTSPSLFWQRYDAGQYR